MLAMSNSGHPRTDGRRAIPSLEVDTVCDCFQVDGVNAVAHPTQVIDNKAVRDSAKRQFIGKPMGGANAVISSGEMTVSMRANVTRPQPACRSFVDSRPEAFSTLCRRVTVISHDSIIPLMNDLSQEDKAAIHAAAERVPLSL